MNCRDAIKQLEPYLDAERDAALAGRLRRHFEACAACRQRLQQETRWRETLANLPVPEPSPDFSERVLAAATSNRSPRVRRRWSTPVVGSAIAASLVMGIALGLWWPQYQADPAPVVAEQAETVQLQTVRLVFEAGNKLQNVTLTLELPDHVELASYPGRHSLSWQVDLKPGQNLLALPLRILHSGEGELVAHLDDGKHRKTFRALISSAEAASSSAHQSS